jgi:hemerythrin superfamily protein
MRQAPISRVRNPILSGLFEEAIMLKAKAIPQNAVALLEADHAQVKMWFAQFEKAKSKSEQQDLATHICRALKVHMEIEEEVFYPAFLEATKDKGMYDEAISEHKRAKEIIEEVANLGPSHAYFHTRVNVLSQMIKHHVKEEERPGGMFDEAKRSKRMDLTALGEELTLRKLQLMEPKTAGDAHEAA